MGLLYLFYCCKIQYGVILVITKKDNTLNFFSVRREGLKEAYFFYLLLLTAKVYKFLNTCIPCYASNVINVMSNYCQFEHRAPEKIVLITAFY